MKILSQEKIRFWLNQMAAWCKPRQEKFLAWCGPQREKIMVWWQPQQEKLHVYATPYLEQLKTRWQSLASREKNVLLGGALATAILLLYALIWSPLNSKLDSLRLQIQGEKKTAAWIQAANKQILALENKQSQAPAKSLSLRINTIQEELRQASIGKNLTQLAQSNANEIHCVFDRVDFDTLIGWLMDFSQQHDLTIKQASVRRLNNIGLVQAEFIFRVGS